MVLFLLVLLPLATAVAPACAQDEMPADSGVRPSEFMIYQYPDVALVVGIDVKEAEFESRISGPDDTLIRDSDVAARRIGPLYQWVDAVDSPRQLMIEVTPSQPVDRSRIKLELIQFQVGDRNSAALAHAYRLYSQGTEKVYGSDSTTWTLKAYTLRTAAAAFADLGMEEMRLWSDYFAAHLVMHQLHDSLQAMEMSREIQKSARRAGFTQVELAALVLESDALMGAAASSGPEQAGRFRRDAHGVLEQTAAVADETGMQSERGRALFNDGQVYEREGELERAVDRYEQAIAVTDAAGDVDLSGEIRGAAATVYETLGRTSGAIELLDRMASDLPEDAAQERARSLFEKGRILNDSYRYAEASSVLSQALQLQKDHPSAEPWGPTGLSLGWSLYSLGDMQQAAAVMEEALARTPLEGNREALWRAYGALANINRAASRFDRAAAYRKRQGELEEKGTRRADWFLESALDIRAAKGVRDTAVPRLLQESLERAREDDDAVTADLALLQLCQARAERGESTACADRDAPGAYQRLQASGLPRAWLQGGLTWSGILSALGRGEQFRGVVEDLVAGLAMLQADLPGVLGAWYWESRAAIFREYLASGLAAGGTGLLLALDRIRLLESGDDRAPAPQDEQASEPLRSLLAAREAASGAEARRLGAEANRQLQQRLLESGKKDRFDPERLNGILHGLGADEAVLGYYFSEDRLYAVLASSGGTKLQTLGRSAPVLSRIGALRENMGRSGVAALLPLLEGLGESLVAPLGDGLPETIYLLPMGPLEGFPFDALRPSGHFLAERHRLVNLRSLAGLEHRKRALDAGGIEKVFLAGGPQAGRVLFDYDLSTSSEISRVTDRFVGPGLHIVQGAALQRDEFFDSRFAEADLIHLAMPGIIDLAYPERSRLALSGQADDTDASHLSPADLQGLRFSAKLAVLSETAAVGQGRTVFDSRIAFVTGLLDAGVGSVVATLWAASDIDTADVMDDFYRRLQSGSDIATALSETRKGIIGEGAETNFGSWARFQLYIR